jgi:hypothetical protein
VGLDDRPARRNDVGQGLAQIGDGFLAEHGRQLGFEPQRGQQAHQLGGFAQGGVDRGFGAHQLFGAGSGGFGAFHGMTLPVARVPPARSSR